MRRSPVRVCHCPEKRRCRATVTGTSQRCRCFARRGSRLCYVHQRMVKRQLRDRRRADLGLEAYPVMVRHRKRTEQKPKGCWGVL